MTNTSTLRHQENKQRGFTLVELLIAMALALVIIAALSSAFVSQRKTYAVQEQISQMIQNARAAMDMISREVEMAGYAPTGYDKPFERAPSVAQTSPRMQRTDPNAARFVGIPYSATQLQIVADTKEPFGTIDTTSDENIIYSYDSANLQIDRNTGSGNQPFAEYIRGLTFTFFDEDGIQINSSVGQSEIRMIKIEIEARTAEEDPNYTHPGNGDGYRTYKLTSWVTPPNLGF